VLLRHGSDLNANHFILFKTAEALAAQVSQENYDKGLIYPPFTNIRKISANIAASVAAKTYELGEFPC
jgi:malate dehydrogenase (oxaloacetate-decarboxylating)(NADP+)